MQQRSNRGAGSTESVTGVESRAPPSRGACTLSNACNSAGGRAAADNAGFCIAPSLIFLGVGQTRQVFAQNTAYPGNSIQPEEIFT